VSPIVRRWINDWDIVGHRRPGLWRRLRPAQLFLGSFALLIFLGTLGLRFLPGLYTGERLGWLDALFTATSAVCVTGLIVVDTATFFTPAGQAFILLLIQLGGLGMITFTSLIIMVLGRRLSLRQEALSSSGTDVAAPQIDFRRLTRDVVRFTFLFEAVGALVLYALWVPRFGWAEAGWHAVFHSVSAFCNAGFSTFSDSMIGFQRSPATQLVIMLLIVLGGLGFLAIEEVYLRARAERVGTRFRMSLHSRIVLAVTGLLIIGAWPVFALLEWRLTLGELPVLDRLVNALFLSVTPRTAGFNTIILLLMGIASSKFSSRLGLPVLVLFLLLGMLAGEEGIGGIAFDNFGAAHVIGTLALAFILFDGGLQTRAQALRSAWKPSALLATVGVLVTSVVTGVAAAHILDIPLLEGILLGSIVGSTDAAAVFSVLRSRGLHLRRRLASTLEIESGSNDPMAIFLTIGLLEVLLGRMELGPQLLQLFVWQLGLGAVMGVAVGFGAVRLINRINLEAAGLYPVLTAACGLLAFGAAAALGGSGFLAIYIAGIILGNQRIVFERGARLFHDGLAWMGQISMFVVLGLLSTPSELLRVAPESLLIAVVLIFVARPVAVVPLLLPFGFSLREQLFVSWVGLKGAVPIILALFPLIFGLPDGALLFNVVFFVVIVSAIVQGGTLPLLAARLGLQVEPEPQPSVTLEITSLRDVNADIVEYTVGERSRAANHRLNQLTLPDGVVVAMIVRDEQLIPPRGSTSILPDDHVFLVLRPETRPLVDRIFSPRMAVDALPTLIEFPLTGSTTVEDLWEFYGIRLGMPGEKTLDAVIRERLRPSVPYPCVPMTISSACMRSAACRMPSIGRGADRIRGSSLTFASAGRRALAASTCSARRGWTAKGRGYEAANALTKSTSTTVSPAVMPRAKALSPSSSIAVTTACCDGVEKSTGSSTWRSGGCTPRCATRQGSSAERIRRSAVVPSRSSNAARGSWGPSTRRSAATRTAKAVISRVGSPSVTSMLATAASAPSTRWTCHSTSVRALAIHASRVSGATMPSQKGNTGWLTQWTTCRSAPAAAASAAAACRAESDCSEESVAATIRVSRGEDGAGMARSREKRRASPWQGSPLHSGGQASLPWVASSRRAGRPTVLHSPTSDNRR
jgi:potassium/hydrogen antiporter